MSPFSRAGPVCQAEINHLEISALLKNTTKNQNLSYEKKPARSTEISLFSTEIPAKRAEFFLYDNSSRAKMAHSAHARLEVYCFIFDSKNRLLSNINNKRLFIFHEKKTFYKNSIWQRADFSPANRVSPAKRAHMKRAQPLRASSTFQARI